jgi:poly(hydroxyalkanoate) depolymerase family esterase
MQFNQRFFTQMREATELLQTSGPAAATAAIQRALHGTPGAASEASKTSAGSAAPLREPHLLVDRKAAAETSAHAAPPPTTDVLRGSRTPFWQSWKGTSFRQRTEEVEVDADVDRAGKGKFLTASCTNDAGSRAYKVYVPRGFHGQALPLIVMLHGCKQNPGDFAAGTGMNAIADDANCFVVYPAQAQTANGSNCWSWFKADDQQRDRGEPSIIADITRDVISRHHIDPSRVYVAGLSAGGAMAAIMAVRYPELYAAVGVHSGLPVGAAHDLPSAFAAMKKGTTTKDRQSAREAPIPIIVFHGDRDRTVHPSNSDQVLAQCIERNETVVTIEKGQVPQGRAYTRIVQRDCNGKAIAEQWIVHGAGHAWSGGSLRGSYTDPKGPNAAREMLRFFSMHVRGSSGHHSLGRTSDSARGSPPASRH